MVYRIFDIVFAEGIEAIFRFSLALMRRNEDKLLALDFEGILKFLGNEVFDCYKVSSRDTLGDHFRLLMSKTTSIDRCTSRIGQDERPERRR